MIEYKFMRDGIEQREIACNHLLEIANLALKYDIMLTDDFGIGDSWYCSSSDISVEMEQLIQYLRSNNK